jgi:hypothetical protein
VQQDQEMAIMVAACLGVKRVFSLAALKMNKNILGRKG